MSFLDNPKCDLTSVAFDPLLALEQGAYGTSWLEKVTPFDHLGQVKSIVDNPLRPLVRESKDKTKAIESLPCKRAHNRVGFFETVKATLGAPLQALQFSKKDSVRVLLRDTHYLYGVAIGRLQAIDRHWNILLFDVHFELKNCNNDTSEAGFSKTFVHPQTYDTLMVRGENVVSICFRSRPN